MLNPSGTIRVHLTRFLHVTLDLTYQGRTAPEPCWPANDGLDELALAPRYRLTATRNVRSNELHYFDHPAFGVLVRITPVQTQNNPRPPAGSLSKISREDQFARTARTARRCRAAPRAHARSSARGRLRTGRALDDVELRGNDVSVRAVR